MPAGGYEIHSTLSPLRLSVAQRKAPKPYVTGSVIGWAVVPPWIHSLLDSAASFDCSGVSSIVVAPAMFCPVGWPTR